MELLDIFHVIYFIIYFLVIKYVEEKYESDIDKIIFNKYGIPKKNIRISSESILLYLVFY